MLNEIKKDADTRMDKSVAALRQELTKLRTGRAHTSLLDHITVEYYGSEVPLNQCANVNVEDPRTLASSTPKLPRFANSVSNSPSSSAAATSSAVRVLPGPGWIA